MTVRPYGILLTVVVVSRAHGTPLFVDTSIFEGVVVLRVVACGKIVVCDFTLTHIDEGGIMGTEFPGSRFDGGSFI